MRGKYFWDKKNVLIESTRAMKNSHTRLNIQVFIVIPVNFCSKKIFHVDTAQQNEDKNLLKTEYMLSPVLNVYLFKIECSVNNTRSTFFSNFEKNFPSKKILHIYIISLHIKVLETLIGCDYASAHIIFLELI